MKPNRIVAIVSLGLLAALSAQAQAVKKAPAPKAKKYVPPKRKIPTGWVRVRTAAFEMSLPRAFRLLGEVVPNPKTPWIGRWRFATVGGRAKMFIRVDPLKKATLEQLLASSLTWLRKRASQFTTLGESTAADEKRREFIIGFYQVTMAAKNHKTKKIEPRPHLAIRAIQQYPEVGLQSAVTYLFTSSKFDEARTFVTQQSQTLKVHDTKAKLDLIRKLGPRFPRAAQSLQKHPMALILQKKVRLKLKGRGRPKARPTGKKVVGKPRR